MALVTDTGRSGTAQGAVGLLRAGTLGLILLAVYLLQHMRVPGADVSWLTTTAERMLAGERLYVDILETNPPLAALLYMPAAWAGHLLGVPVDPLVIVWALGVALGSTLLASRILLRSGLVADVGLFQILALLVLAAAPGVHFAQREHFALMLMLPAVAALATRSARAAVPSGLVVLAGVIAGLALGIKPHFILGFAPPLLLSVFRARSYRPLMAPEVVVAALVLALFWCWTWLAFPAFFSDILPSAGVVYVADRLDLGVLLVLPATWLFWLMAAAVLLLYRAKLRTDPLALALLVSAFGFALAYVLQGKGFAYHLLPAMLPMLLTLALLALEDRRRDRLPLALAFAALALAPSISHAVSEPELETIAAPLQPYGPGLTIANISPQIDAASPLHRMIGARFSTLGPFLWQALGAIKLRLRSSDPVLLAKAAAIEAKERDRLASDLQRHPPDIVLTGADGFDWLGWAEGDPRIAALLRDYQPLADLPLGGEVLHILKRPGLEPRTDSDR